MIDSLIEATALPNLHPALVHFPLAFFPLALAFEAAGLVLDRQRWLAPAATALYGLAALGAWLAVWAGERAADGLVGLPAAVQPRIGEHSDWAHWALYSLAVVAVLRFVVHLRPGLSSHRGARAAVVLIGLGALGALGKAADLGGALVYEHGVAVQRATAEPEMGAPSRTEDIRSPTAETHARERLVHREDGALVWRPAAGDREALGEVLVPPPGSGLEAIRWVEAGEGAGLALDADGSATLLFPGAIADVQVEVHLELLGFDGTVGLVHHFRDDRDGDSFTVSTDGVAALEAVREGESQSLDRQDAALPTGPFVLAVSAAGRHLKGLIDGKTVTHGHISPAQAGACGLRIEGRGRLRILQASVVPLEGH